MTGDFNIIKANDVLCGRGGATNHHPGNIKYRKLVADYQSEYLVAKKNAKAVIARRIVAAIMDSGGRFLKHNDQSDVWVEVPIKKATEKTSQALREGLDVRQNALRAAKAIRPSSDSLGENPRRAGPNHEEATFETTEMHRHIHNVPPTTAFMTGDSNNIKANDVLCGRGGATNNHPGNIWYRKLVADYQAEYLVAKKKTKANIARRIVAAIMVSGGRFLKHNDQSDVWVEVPIKKATEKTSQALREGLDVQHKTLRPMKTGRPSSEFLGDNPRKRARLVEGSVVKYDTGFRSL
jgi:hypothetical protein